MLIEYTPTCGYNQTSLDNEIVVFGETAKKKIIIDNGEAYVDSISGTYFRRIPVNSIDFSETQTLSGRYLFEKTVNFVVNGHYGKSLLNDMRYLMVKLRNGSYRLVTVDFPAEMSYEFRLDSEVYQTQYTLHTYSNFPSLAVSGGSFGDMTDICGYHNGGIGKILLNLRKNVLLDRVSGKLITNGEDFRTVDVLRGCSVTESYSDESVSAVTVMSLTIPVSDYKSSWHYNVSEFSDNRFSALISPVGSPQTLFLGFGEGMMPLYTENATESDGSIEIEFTERSEAGLCALYDYTDEVRSQIRYVNVSNVDGIDTWECFSEGVAQYLVQKEVDGLGNPTGNYLAYTGYEEHFSELGINITGTFDTNQTFPSNKCLWNTCSIQSDLPSSINFTGTGTSETYYVHSNCDWEVSYLPSGFTSSVSGGTAGAYTSISFTNTLARERKTQIIINAGGTSLTVNVTVGADVFVYPSSVTVNCLSHTVPFVADSTLCSDITPSGNVMVSKLGAAYFNAYIPENTTESARTFSIAFTNNCSDNTQTVMITQDRQYVEWQEVDNDYVCEEGKKYVLLHQFTGVTDNIEDLHDTGVRRKGSEITGDDECKAVETEYVAVSDYVCEDGHEYQLLAERTRFVGSSSAWTYTGRHILGDEVSYGSHSCDHSLTVRTYDNGYYIVDGATIISRDDIFGMIGDTNSVMSAVIGDSVTTLGYKLFSGCSMMLSCDTGSGITTIYSDAFRDCGSLTSFSFPSGVRSVWEGVLRNCSSLTAVTMPVNVTTIPDRFMQDCKSVTFIEMPYNVTQIGNYAFSGCESLTLRMVRPQPPVLDLGDESVYCHFDMVQAIEIPSASMPLYSTADGWRLWQSKFVAY